jgi:N-carbamoyl-L-amino-acid hydrolase
MAAVGATGRGGVNRQALTEADSEGRALVLGWARARGFSCTVDAIGNLFVHREGRWRDGAPVMTGSHLDTQPTGGNFDGVYGVLAGLELMETLEDHGRETLRPIELAVWTNEEGSRFQPTTMGSAVFAGALPLDVALQTVDRDGVSVSAALDRMLGRLGGLPRRDRRLPCFAYVEAHIEQGPLLEAALKPIGIVRAIQGLRQFVVTVAGEGAHAGTTPMKHRKDALVEAMGLVGELQSLTQDREDVLRFTVGRFDVSPGSPNTVPSDVVFTIDLRHPDDAVLLRVGNRILDICRTWAGRCAVEAKQVLCSGSVKFNPAICKASRSFAEARGYGCLDMMSGATHDAKYVSMVCPAGMIFVPCKNGISHSENETVADSDLVAGANVLLDTVAFLSERKNGL